MPGMTDRDHFAAAALTGLLSLNCPGPNQQFPQELCERAYRWADAMLRERAKKNHDAAPAATAGTPGTGDTQSFDAYRRFVGEVMNWISEATSAADWSSDGGRKILADACSRCWDAFDRIAPTDHGASPEARASVDSVAPQPTTRGDSDRTDKAAPRPSDGTGDTPDTPKPIKGGVSDRSKPINGLTPVHTPPAHTTPGEGSVPREGAEPVAWAVMDGHEFMEFCTDKEEAKCAAGFYGGCPIVPLYRSPTLTDAEREAVEFAVAHGETVDAAWRYALRGLLERLGGGR